MFKERIEVLNILSLVKSHEIKERAECDIKIAFHEQLHCSLSDSRFIFYKNHPTKISSPRTLRAPGTYKVDKPLETDASKENKLVNKKWSRIDGEVHRVICELFEFGI